MHSLLVKCENCGNLETLYKKVECSILYMMHRKHSILVYNLAETFDECRFKSLIRYKRVLEKRMYNNNYPSSTISTSQLVARISELAFKDDSCSQCPTCFPLIN